MDMIGAARPSIADPFLPKKIEEGRIEDIRECIGCNICVAWDIMAAPMRCTQNPTKGEEWRKGWHPERIPEKASDSTVLVVGAGPAGLEASRALAQRGYDVILSEKDTSWGGVSHVRVDCRVLTRGAVSVIIASINSSKRVMCRCIQTAHCRLMRCWKRV